MFNMIASAIYFWYANDRIDCHGKMVFLHFSLFTQFSCKMYKAVKICWKCHAIQRFTPDYNRDVAHYCSQKLMELPIDAAAAAASHQKKTNEKN